ncbi:MAG: hypothetical protein ABIA47_05125 [bacterium]
MRKKTTYLFPIIIIIIVALSIALIFAVDPEQTLVTSPDGVLTVEGVARITQPFQIDLTDPAGGDVLFGSVYDVDPGVYLDEPATLTFTLSDFESPDNIVVYRYDSSLMMWERMNREVERSAELIAIEADTLGRFSLGRMPEVEAPNFLTSYDDLIGMAPEGAVGFEMATGFVINNGPKIKLSDSDATGGCGGIVGQGNSQEVSRVEQEAVVLFDDAQTQVTFIFTARWFVSDAGGCGSSRGLEFYSDL